MFVCIQLEEGRRLEKGVSPSSLHTQGQREVVGLCWALMGHRLLHRYCPCLGHQLQEPGSAPVTAPSLPNKACAPPASPSTRGSGISPSPCMFWRAQHSTGRSFRPLPLGQTSILGGIHLTEGVKALSLKPTSALEDMDRLSSFHILGAV